MVKTLPSYAEGAGLIPGQGAKVLLASGPKNQNIKQKQHCNKFNKECFLKKKSSGITKHVFVMQVITPNSPL